VLQYTYVQQTARVTGKGFYHGKQNGPGGHGPSGHGVCDNGLHWVQTRAAEWLRFYIIGAHGSH